MRYLSEYRDPTIAKKLIEDIKRLSKKPVKFMEVCGTHTVSISKNGIRQVLPENISLLSGPGCPVCVTANGDIDKAIAIAEAPDVIFTTFGDMMKVPGSYSSLAGKRADGADVRIVYSTLDALKIAKNNPDKKVVFFAVGFETTAPTIALSILEAHRQGIKNYFIYSVHKLVPPAMAALLNLGEVKLDGFICPGHVSVIIGSKPYEFIARDYKISCVIAGFEPIDILQSIYMLVSQVENGEAKVEIGYKRGVSFLGNTKAQEVMEEVFRPCDADWRGIGVIPESGLALSNNFKGFDAVEIFDIDVPPTREPVGCSCGEILRGVKLPYDCKLFGKACTPENPAGPCMVSTEGSCAAYYRYGESS
ncbi:MAG TPA: hydrogenase formation protein HypD [Actinobacteria bacterium]|nr:hydrogenase formation protein HypD [Actinomycetota bacterium]